MAEQVEVKGDGIRLPQTPPQEVAQGDEESAAGAEHKQVARVLNNHIHFAEKAVRALCYLLVYRWKSEIIWLDQITLEMMVKIIEPVVPAFQDWSDLWTAVQHDDKTIVPWIGNAIRFAKDEPRLVQELQNVLRFGRKEGIKSMSKKVQAYMEAAQK